MRWRKVRWVLAGLAASLGAACVLILWPETEAITREQFVRVHPGMDEFEVEAILGPPGDYSTEPTLCAIYNTRERFDGFTRSLWGTDRLLYFVDFDEQGRVMDISNEENSPLGVDHVTALRWRIERQWRRWFPE